MSSFTGRWKSQSDAATSHRPLAQYDHANLTLLNLACYNDSLSSGGAIIYAIVETGGKQYRVSPGQTLRVERLAAAEGAQIELSRVLAIGNDGKLTLGRPAIDGASIMATVKGEGQGDKIAILRFKSKVRYSHRQGHRQPYTELLIDSITAPGISAEKPQPRARKAAKAEEAVGAAVKKETSPRKKAARAKPAKAEKAREAATKEKAPAKKRTARSKKEVSQDGT